MHAAIAHLPGCDLNHRPRQRCSTWTPPAETPVVASLTDRDRHGTPPRGGTTSWRLVAFNIVAVTNAVWTAWMMTRAVLYGAGCEGNDCEDGLGPVISWFLAELLLIPVVLVTFGAVVADDGRRRLKPAWPGYVAIAAFPATIAAALLVA